MQEHGSSLTLIDRLARNGCNWGSYLIEPSDADAIFEAPKGFFTKVVYYTMYIAAAAVIVILVVLIVFMVRRRRASRL